MAGTKNAVFITGGVTRIGKAISLYFAKKGHDIAIHYYDDKNTAEQVKNEIEKIGVKCRLYYRNFADIKTTLTLVSEIKKDFSNLDTVVNNASVFEEGYLKDTSLDLFEQQFSINFKAPFFITKEFANITDKGHVINIIDTNAKKNFTRYFSYTLSKKVLFDFTKMAAKELAPDIRVNGICPGAILPPKGEDESFWQQRIPKIPLKIKGDVDFVVNGIDFFLNNPFITGHCLFIDGGEHLR